MRLLEIRFVRLYYFETVKLLTALNLKGFLSVHLSLFEIVLLNELETFTLELCVDFHDVGKTHKGLAVVYLEIRRINLTMFDNVRLLPMSLLPVSFRAFDLLPAP